MSIAEQKRSLLKEPVLSLLLREGIRPLLVVDNDGDIYNFNKPFLEAFGYDADELLSMSLQDVLLDLNVKNMLDSKESSVGPVKVIRRCGVVDFMTIELSEIHLQGNNYIIVLFRDEIGTGLHLVRQFSSVFLRDINLGVLLINKYFQLIEISDMACKLFDVNRGVVLHQSVDEIFQSVPEEYKLIQRTVLDGINVKNHAVSWSNGDLRYELLMDSNLLYDVTGEKVGAYVIFKDVSNLRSLEEQVQRSDRLAMIGQIAAGTAHEIRNPLTSIKGFLQMLKKTLHDHHMEKEQTFTDIMLTEINRINDLVGEFLLLSKPRDVAFCPVDVCKVLEEILPIIHNEAILHGVNIVHKPFNDRLIVIADRKLLKQVFLNICKNGIEAANGGVLSISKTWVPEEKQIQINIHDSGHGIPPFLIDKIFDPFFTTKDNGTGLGLSVCQRIIHDIGGSLRVSSKGFGTTFTISLPYVEWAQARHLNIEE